MRAIAMRQVPKIESLSKQAVSADFDTGDSFRQFGQENRPVFSQNTVDGTHQIALLRVLLIVKRISTGVIAEFFVLPTPNSTTAIATAALCCFHKFKK